MFINLVIWIPIRGMSATEQRISNVISTVFNGVHGRPVLTVIREDVITTWGFFASQVDGGDMHQRLTWGLPMAAPYSLTTIFDNLSLYFTYSLPKPASGIQVRFGGGSRVYSEGVRDWARMCFSSDSDAWLLLRAQANYLHTRFFLVPRLNIGCRAPKFEAGY
jgi:hypothetical protein